MIQPCGRRRVGAALHHVANARVEPDLVSPATAPQRPRHDEPVERDDAARVGRPPAERLRCAPASGRSRCGTRPAACPARGRRRAHTDRCSSASSGDGSRHRLAAARWEVRHHVHLATRLAVTSVRFSTCRSRARSCARDARPHTMPSKAGPARRVGSPNSAWRASRIATDVSSPTRSSSANGPIGKLQPPFMAVSMRLMRRRALLEHAHRVVEVREQQRVDDEAGTVLHLDRVLAARRRRRPWRRRSSRRWR